MDCIECVFMTNVPCGDLGNSDQGRKQWRVVVNGLHTHYVITSAANVQHPFLDSELRPETFVFPCDKFGEIWRRVERPGSFTGGLDHRKAIEGYLRYLSSIFR